MIRVDKIRLTQVCEECGLELLPCSGCGKGWLHESESCLECGDPYGGNPKVGNDDLRLRKEIVRGGAQR